MFGGNSDKLERELERMARRKYKIVVSMQRYAKFTKEERENTESPAPRVPGPADRVPRRRTPAGRGRRPPALLRHHRRPLGDHGERHASSQVPPSSCLGQSSILGDGKSDNRQNHAIIFYRGEYIQLIDANQDNYLEECLKIRSVLAEFEEMRSDEVSPYAPGNSPESASTPSPFSEPTRVHLLREHRHSRRCCRWKGTDVWHPLLPHAGSGSAGKLLHYGHPDFLNGIFMTTRGGGVQGPERRLHLNEDIYAGMNAILRGGRIKHCEYYQCGKGRDLGFGSILNFTTKIGTGMGEQMLSREYYYLGTQLPATWIGSCSLLLRAPRLPHQQSVHHALGPAVHGRHDQSPAP